MFNVEVVMRKRTLVLLLALMLCAALAPARTQAGGQKWSAWMFNQKNGDLAAAD